MKYQLWINDVWGNEEDGWDVNCQYKADIVELPDNATDIEILKAVDAAPFVRIDNQISDNHIIYFTGKDDDYPYGSLELINEED